MDNKEPIITKEKIGEEIITISKMEPIIKNLKEFITATVKGSEANLDKKIETVRVELKKEINQLKVTVDAHSNALLDLSRDVKGIKSDVAVLKTDVAVLKTEVKDIKGTVHRLEEKGNDHEERITVIEREMHP